MGCTTQQDNMLGFLECFAARPGSTEEAKTKDVKDAEKKPNVLAYSTLQKVSGAVYNPEWTAGGNEGGVDTNKLPWLPLLDLGVKCKPLRVSQETGQFTILVRMEKGTTMPAHICLGANDFLVLSGELTFPEGKLKGKAGPGVWGYTPANHKMVGMYAAKATEYLATFYAPAAFLNADGSVKSLLTGQVIAGLAHENKISLVPNTLAEALLPAPEPYAGKGDPLAISDAAMSALCARAEAATVTELTNPHYVDTNALPWITNPDAPEIAIKVMRVSTETGAVSLIVRQNGQAPPHYHLGPADFFITSGRIGSRAGPKEGYGAGTYMYEPAGARHESTQRVTDEDLIYTANLYGPIQFDTGLGTPVLAVLSWMQYLAAAEASNSPLIASTFPNDQA